MNDQKHTPDDAHNVRPPKVLIVDDSGVNREVMKIFLARDFPEPYLARNGHEAVNILLKHPVDIVLMDIHMPIMDGLKATKIIRESQKDWANIKIIAVTGDDHFHRIEVCKRYAFDDVMAKPVLQEELVTKIMSTWRESLFLEQENNSQNQASHTQSAS